MKKINFKKGLIGTLKNLAISGLLLAISYGALEGMFHLAFYRTHYRPKENGLEYFSIQKAEIPLSIRYFRRQKYNDRISEIYGKHFFINNYNYFTDSGENGEEPDGLVDLIELDSKIKLRRKQHYKDFKQEFDKADKYIAETKEIFTKELKQYNIE